MFLLLKRYNLYINIHLHSNINSVCNLPLYNNFFINCSFLYSIFNLYYFNFIYCNLDIINYILQFNNSLFWCWLFNFDNYSLPISYLWTFHIPIFINYNLFQLSIQRTLLSFIFRFKFILDWNIEYLLYNLPFNRMQQFQWNNSNILYLYF